MQLSAAGLDLVKKSEGFRPTTYFDIANYPTIGYGHRLEPNESYPRGICETDAEVILLWDVRTAEQAISRLVTVALSQGQFDALVDFAFNLGSGRLATSTLLLDLNAGRSDDAALQLLRWDHSGDREIAALKSRRQAEYRLWTGHEAIQVAQAGRAAASSTTTEATRPLAKSAA
ncbi:MAG TPA: lysozyme [Terracidiphilus sp.]|jgi:lysozyme|nr:lysozyme [Terracidiphilus sp.]